MESVRSDPLMRLYATYIETPRSADEAYGYWLFIAGLIIASVGIALVLPTSASQPLRGVALATAAIGLVLLLVGFVVRLPLRRRSLVVSYLGSLVATLAVVWFGVEFRRGSWSADFDNNEPFIIALYGLGVLAIMLGAVLVPVLTGAREQQGAEDTDGEEETDETTQRADRQAARRRRRRVLRKARRRRIRDSQSQFELYTDSAGEIRWRLRHRNHNIIATSGEGYATRRGAQQGIDAVRRDASGAPLVDLDRTDVDIETAGERAEGESAPAFVAGLESTATFETHRDDSGQFRWTLVSDDGTAFADSSRGYSSQDARDDAIEAVRHHARTASYLTLDAPAFELYRDWDDSFRWRLLDTDGTVLATAGEGYSSRQAARGNIGRIRRNVTDAGGAEFDVYVDPDGEHRWRLVHENSTIIASSIRGHADETDAQAAVERVREAVADADVLDIGSATFELYADTEGAWQWRLRHPRGPVIAEAADGHDDRTGAEATIRRVKRNASRASARGRISTEATAES